MDDLRTFWFVIAAGVVFVAVLVLPGLLGLLPY